ncbi:MAG: tetratricopeptide repeat protein [Pseudomonadota bacterium]
MSTTISPQQADQLRRRAQTFQHEGRYRKAVEVQIELINSLGGYATERSEDMHLLGLYLFQLGDIAAAETILTQVFGYQASDVDVVKNLAICQLKLGKQDAAINLLAQCAEQNPENFEVRDVLAHAAGQKGDLSLAHQHGRRALELKHANVVNKTERVLSLNKPAAKLEMKNPPQNIIAFSLWGKQAKYLDGAIRNAKLAPDIYPSWRCRFYVDQSVPLVVTDKLRSFGAEIVEMPSPNRAFDGLFWRFLAADDPTVSRFIIRDCDAVLNIRERGAVDEWCHSGKHFHVMRDFYTHTELILAGMWGGVTKVLPNMAEAIERFTKQLQLRTRIIDQIFLREQIWPKIYPHTLVHDSQFGIPESKDFPEFAVLREGQHVGQDRSIFR